MKSLALALAFQEAPPRKKLLPLVKELERLLTMEFDRVVGLMVAQGFLRKFDELDDLVSETMATASFDNLFQNAVSSGFTGISIASPDVSDVIQYQKDWGSSLVTGILQQSAKQLNDIIAQGIKDGKAREQIANDLYRARGDDGILPDWRARLIAQTEVIRSYNAGSRIDKILLGATHLKWLDGQRGACPSCRGLHNTVIPVDVAAGKQPHFVDGIRGFTVLHPPLHPACRCSIATATQDDYDAQEAKPLTAPGKATNIPGVAQPVPAKATAADDFRKWYALHGEGKTGVAAAQAYAKFKGQPMKTLMDKIKLEGYDVKTLIAHPIGTALPPRNKAIKIPAPGASAKKPAAAPAKTVTLSKLDVPLPRDPDFWDELVQYKAQAGSNPGGFYQHPKTGEKFYIKEYKDMGQAAAELAALQTFKQLGFTVPTAQIVTRGGKSVYVSNLLDDVIPATRADLDAYFKKHPDELVKLHLGATVTSNWDVIGMSYDNIVFVKGKPAIIDAGGSYTYRAQGGAKVYDGSVKDFDTLMNAAINAQSASVFGKLYQTADDVDIALAAVQAMRKGTADLFATFPSGAAYKWGTDQIARLDALESLLQGKRAMFNFTPPAPVTGLVQLSPYDLMVLNKNFPLTAAAKTAVLKYSGSWASTINDQLRTGRAISTTDMASVKRIDAAMQPTPVAYTLRRGVHPFAGSSNLGIGFSFDDKGFMSTTVRDTATFGSIKFRLEVPAGTPHIPMDGMSKHPGEEELLLGRGARILVTGKDPVTGEWIATVTYD